MTGWLAVPVNRSLAAAAFGDDPGCWPLPGGTTPVECWLRAVAAGGQGRYSCATADLAIVRRVDAGPLGSLAYSTNASFLRQLGGHALARGWDGRALAPATLDTGAARPATLDTGAARPATLNTEALVDALIGLAADALGMNRFGASTALLKRARAVLDDLDDTEDPAGRLPLRLEWVAAELAMVSGAGQAAVRHAERARELAATSPSLRHRVKTDVVLAAALCSAGLLARSRGVADDALLATGRLGLVPLQWAVASLLVDIGSDVSSGDGLRAVRDGCAVELQQRGGVWYR